MAQWKETLEPYVKVYERVKETTLSPTAGEDLIVGAVIISDSGPSVPTLITSQSEFLKTYATGDITREYINSLNKMYVGEDKTLAATMWSNAYRLAGSCNMLVCRASKASDIFYAKPLDKQDNHGTYVFRDGELLKKVNSFKLVIDEAKDEADHDQNGWSINISGVGIIGNRTTDEGPQYDYNANNLPDLVEVMNGTSKFFSPSFKFYSDAKATIPVEVDMSNLSSKSIVKSVIFEEVYLGDNLIDTEDPRCPNGCVYTLLTEPDWTPENPNQKIYNVDAFNRLGATDALYYATNIYNASNDLKVRIRRFNHDAVVAKEITNSPLSAASASPWTVLTSVLDTFTSSPEGPSEAVLARDFYEVCVLDPSISKDPLFFNLGNVSGRGDITPSELNEMLSMIQLELPDDLNELGLNYFDYEDELIWAQISDQEAEASGGSTGGPMTYNELLNQTATVGTIYTVGSIDNFEYYRYQSNGNSQIFVDLGINVRESHILDVSNTDLNNAVDKISIDEVYVTEGLSDLGNTEPSFQNKLAVLAMNENYFYPISTVNSTNYMTIANSANKIPHDSSKLYLSAPWDIDTGTLGWKFYASPSVLYWESVARNRRNNEEFRAVMGQSGGIALYQKPVTEFNKKTRQLLLSKRINTVLWNISTNAWNMNDNYTKQSVDNILSDEGNSRLAIRISKSMPVLLRQFIGRKISAKLWADAKDIIDYWFKSSIMPMPYSVDAYQIIIDETNNPVEIQRQNKMAVTVNVRYQRSLKYVNVYHNIFDVGQDISSADSYLG